MSSLSLIILISVIFTTAIAQEWTQLPGAANDISAKGNEVWVINKAQQIYRWVGNDWKHMPGAAVRVGASPDGWSWVVNSADAIYRWNVGRNDWDNIPGALVQISAASKDSAIGVNRGGLIYLWENNNWKQLPGGNGMWAAIGDDNERWLITKDQALWRWNHARGDWDRNPGSAGVNIDVSSPFRVMHTNSAQDMFILKDNTWHHISGKGTRGALSHNHFYHVNGNDLIFKGQFKEERCDAAQCPRVQCDCPPRPPPCPPQQKCPVTKCPDIEWREHKRSRERDEEEEIVNVRVIVEDKK